MPEKMAAKRTWITPEAQQKRVKIITAAILLGACLGPFAFLLTLVRGTPAIPTIPPTATYTSQATAVVTSWVEGRPSPIPTATGINENLGRDSKATPARLPITNLAWSSFEREAGFSDPKYFIEIHSFTAVMNKQLIVIEVPIATQGDGPVLVALPSIVPSRFLPGQQEIAFSLLPYGENSSASDGGRTQIREWAKAYGRNDTEALFRLTGDPEKNTYQGLPTGNYILLNEPKIDEVVVPFGTDGKLIANTAIVRVTLDYAQPYTQQEIDAAKASGGNENLTTETPNLAKSMKLTFDLLVVDTDRNLPFIAAWGAPGTGPTLEPYSNAVKFAPQSGVDNGGSSTTTTTASSSTSSTTNRSGGTTSTSRPTSSTPPPANATSDNGEQG